MCRTASCLTPSPVYRTPNHSHIGLNQRAPPCLQSCLWYSWTGSLGGAEVKRVFVLVVAELHCCFLQMMWFCWLHQNVTFSTHWICLQPSVKRPEWESAPPSLRPWCSVEKSGWLLPEGSEDFLNDCWKTVRRFSPEILKCLLKLTQHFLGLLVL